MDELLPTDAPEEERQAIEYAADLIAFYPGLETRICKILDEGEDIASITASLHTLAMQQGNVTLSAIESAQAVQGDDLQTAEVKYGPAVEAAAHAAALYEDVRDAYAGNPSAMRRIALGGLICATSAMMTTSTLLSPDAATISTPMWAASTVGGALVYKRGMKDLFES